jgi:fatty acyl-CoA reductase
LAIVRPSIVTAALREPFPGWIDNLNGPTGLIAGGGKGFIRVFKVENAEFVTDLIPVDLSINLMIAVAWRTAMYKCVKISFPRNIFTSPSSKLDSQFLCSI